MREDELMLEGVLIVVVTVIVVLAVAAAVVAMLALQRRSADDWKNVLRSSGKELREEITRETPLGSRETVQSKITPTRTSLDSVLSGAHSTSAYFDADRLPGIDRLETMTERVSERMERTRKGVDSSAE